MRVRVRERVFLWLAPALVLVLLSLSVAGCGDPATPVTASSLVTTAPSEASPPETLASNSPLSEELAPVVPSSLAGVPATRYLEGDGARLETEQLHGKALGAGLDEAYLVSYGDEQATLWVTRALEERDAVDLFERMKLKIAQSETPFTNPKTLTVAGVSAEALDGMGQKHYYFRIGRDLYWLAVAPAAADASLDELVSNGLRTATSE